ncbi:RDD family protein [Gracilibacillus kekensis]|uniref:Uncharacterized membrane protein YckC, RDD family n=1 Tax=Gracilibacillus kekensis TaxID=1027249 RepID=A0A1M7IWR0_9BACI|nr:RDD family protein [Gracilibacillus kekensis]SHM45129.1 Uncharacterized membrane protein YckC, RDD family [Gracilibacillus kekensis]
MEEIKIASRKSRIFAFMIDHFVLTIIAVFPLIIYLMNAEMQAGFIVAFVGLWIFIFFIFFTIRDTFKGKSLGKRIIGITVRDAKNIDSVPTISRLFVRNLLVIIWPVEFIVLATKENKQRLGDEIARTVVVKERDLSLWKLISVILFVIIFSIGILISTILLLVKNSDAYEASINYIENSEEIVEETGGIEGFGFLPSGSVQISNGEGETVYSIRVKGKDEDILVEVYLTKEPSQDWVVQEVYYE